MIHKKVYAISTRAVGGDRWTWLIPALLLNYTETGARVISFYTRMKRSKRRYPTPKVYYLDKTKIIDFDDPRVKDYEIIGSWNGLGVD